MPKKIVKKKTAPRPLSWAVRRRGEHYCSPACGFGCTYKMYTEALDEGGKLAKRLGPDWTFHVWENIGWHYRAEHKSGHLSVYRNNPNGVPTRQTYTAYASQSRECAGGEWTATSNTPETALSDVLTVARAAILPLCKLLSDLSAHVEKIAPRR